MYAASNYEGMIIEGYRTIELLGRGSFGEVWKAEGPGGTQAALKFIDLGGKSGLKEFRALQRVKQIRHANLMPITAIWLVDESGVPLEAEHRDHWSAGARSVSATSIPVTGSHVPKRMIVAMPLADKNLLDRLHECQSAGLDGIPVEELLNYLEDAAKAIDYLNTPRHQVTSTPVAIQHGDIKPQNITIVGASAQLCDFGLVRVLGDPRVTTMLGSPAYVAPECVQHGTPSRTADQYSLAVSYVELRTGELPFDDKTYSGVLNAHLHSQLNLSRLGDAERSVIRKATALNPDERYSTALDMIRALRNAHENTSSQANEKPAPRRVSGGTLRRSDDNAFVAAPNASGECGWKQANRVNRRFLARVSLAAAVLIVFMGVGGWYRSTRSDARPTVDVVAENMPPELRDIQVDPSALVAGDDVSIDVIGFDPEGDPITYQYRTAPGVPWKRALGERIRLSELAVGSLTVQIRARDSHGHVSDPVTRVLSVARPNRPPVAEIVSVEPARPIADRGMTVKLLASDPDEDPVTLQFRTGSAGPWQPVDGEEIRFEGLSAGSLTLEVRAVDGEGQVSPAVERSWSVAQPNRAPHVTIAKVEPKKPLAGDTLFVELYGSDPDDDAVTLQYRTDSADLWRTVDDDQIRLEELQAGSLTLEVRAIDRQGLVSPLVERSWSVVQPNRAPRVAIAKVEPKQPRAGDTVNVGLHGTDPDDDPLRFEFRTGVEDAWQPAEGGRFTLEDVEPGLIELEVRALDDEGLASSQLRQAILVQQKLPAISLDEFETAVLPSFDFQTYESAVSDADPEPVVAAVSNSSEAKPAEPERVVNPVSISSEAPPAEPKPSSTASDEGGKTAVKSDRPASSSRRNTTPASAKRGSARYGSSYGRLSSPWSYRSLCGRGGCH